MVDPSPAPSVKMPMIESPPTVSPQRVTLMSASNRSTHWTNFAVARACRPLRFTICISRDSAPSNSGAGGQSSSALSLVSFPGEDLAGDGDVFAARLARFDHRVVEIGSCRASSRA